MFQKGIKHWKMVLLVLWLGIFNGGGRGQRHIWPLLQTLMHIWAFTTLHAYIQAALNSSRDFDRSALVPRPSDIHRGLTRKMCKFAASISRLMHLLITIIFSASTRQIVFSDFRLEPRRIRVMDVSARRELRLKSCLIGPCEMTQLIPARVRRGRE